MTKKILIADDEPDTLDLCSKVLERAGHEVFTANNGVEAIRMIRETPFDLLLLDIRMPGKNGLEVLDVATTIGQDTIMITAYSSVETAVEAMKKGAKDYVVKPLTAFHLRSVVDGTLSQQGLLRTEICSREGVPGFCGLVGSSPSMQELYRIIESIAETDCTVLIEGESGTGKELIAHAIHTKSRRSKNPFIPIDCGAIPETLLESELFGHARGAFTGAIESKEGLFEAASGGTVFIDEIAEMPTILQVKLLRVLQERKIRPVGTTKEKEIDVRVITATNKELSKEIAKGRFRDDLFYRLGVIALKIPPLRERKGDIPTLVHHFIKKHNQLYSKGIEGLSMHALESLKEYHWPGNVRELENVIERAVILEKGKEITPKSLIRGNKIIIGEGGEPYKRLEEVEKGYIETVLEATKWNRTKAARVLGIGRRTLYDKIAFYDIKEQD